MGNLVATPFRVSRDIVVVGASAGGVEALRELMRLLPADLPAAIFVVLHVPPTGSSVLPMILDRVGTLPVAHAVDGDAIERGRPTSTCCSGNGSSWHGHRAKTVTGRRSIRCSAAPPRRLARE